jgi:hypothetical protein
MSGERPALTEAEDFLDFYEIPYNPALLKSGRLALLRRFRRLLQQEGIAFPSEETERKGTPGAERATAGSAGTSEAAGVAGTVGSAGASEEAGSAGAAGAEACASHQTGHIGEWHRQRLLLQQAYAEVIANVGSRPAEFDFFESPCARCGSGCPSAGQSGN